MGASCRRLQPRELMESRKLLEAMVAYVEDPIAKLDSSLG